MAIVDELAALGDLRTAIETLPIIGPRELDLTIQLYGVVAGGDDERVVFVRRANPRVAYGSGKLFAIGGERLTRLDEPAFSFAPRFDFVVGDGWVIVLDQRAFEMVYRDIGMVSTNIERWIGGITDFLPMSADDVEVLRAVACTTRGPGGSSARSSSAGTSSGSRSIRSSSTPRSSASTRRRSWRGDRLRFDPAQRFSFLHLLNEDLYKGQLTDELFEAQRKSPAGP